MNRLALLVVVAACGGAPLQTIQLVNQTNRQIEQIFVYPAGAGDHGPTRGSLAPGASVEVKAKQGSVEVLAVSAKLKVDEHTRDQPSASGTVELVAPARVVFYDADSKPAGLNAPNVFGVAFQLPKPAPAPDAPQAP